MAKAWRFLPHDSVRVDSLMRSMQVPPLIAQLLVNRGLYDQASAAQFLETKLHSLRDPMELPGVQQAIEVIGRGISAKRSIVVFGDYDADGMTGTAILYRCLQLLGADVTYHIPNRLEEGYGLQEDSLRRLQTLGRELVITVDCGIASVAEAALCQELGMQLVITDHHQFAPSLPVADAIVHPRLPGSTYPFGELCGAGVAFKLAWALCQQASGEQRVSDRLRAFLLQSLGLAAIGTVADVVPLLDENRIIVCNGLKSLVHHPTVGVTELLKVIGIADKRELSSEDIGFSIAPRLNAAGRLGQAPLGVDLLTTDDPSRAQQLAEYIHQLNSSRESLERSVYLAANKQAKERFDPEQDPALVLAGPQWHPGVLGVVAGRMAERYGRPVIILSQDASGTKPLVGSARSAGGVDLHAVLGQCQQHLVAHGGHAAAAGMKLHFDRLDAFREDFCQTVSHSLEGNPIAAPLLIDAEATFGQLTLESISKLDRLSPFGQGNPRPLLCASSVRLAEPSKRIGSGERHLSARFVQSGVTMRSVAFGQADWCEPLNQHTGPIDLAYRPIINDFKGRRTVELQLVDWRPSTMSNAN
jgi:single-stranded-DNA-specific exonuclease